MWRTFIQVMALLLTIEAAVFLGRGNLGLSAEAVAQLASTKWDYNSDLVLSLAVQRADTWAGVVLLLCGLILQIANTIWPMRIQDFDVNRNGVVLAVACAVVVWLIAVWASNATAAATVTDVQRILTTT